MDLLILALSVCSWIIATVASDPNILPNNSTDPNITPNNSSDPNKDMYVINAMMYQVGIITNKTDGNLTDVANLGNQESVTFFHNNGSNVDLSVIPPPLVTNVTAQRVVGVVPRDGMGVVPRDGMGPNGTLAADLVPWAALQQFASLPSSELVEKGYPDRDARDLMNESETEGLESGDEAQVQDPDDASDTMIAKIYKRSLPEKRVTQQQIDTEKPVVTVQGTAEIPPEVGVQSLAIPPLLLFNKNFSNVPVPIPNTAVVHYAKVNTLITNAP